MRRLSRQHSFDMRQNSIEKDKINNGMSEKVQIIANSVYKEFERLISFYGSNVVEYLMPLIVGVLENLEELYRTKQTYEIELQLIKDDNLALNSQYEKEKSLKKQAEERILHVEYAYEEDKRSLEDKLITSESVIRHFELRARNSSDTILRLEEKVQILKVENQKLYERYKEVLKSHADQLSRLKADVYPEISSSEIILPSKIEKILTRHYNFEPDVKSVQTCDDISRLPMIIESDISHNDLSSPRYDNMGDSSPDNMLTSDYTSHEEENLGDILANDQWMTDFTDGNENDSLSEIKYRGIIVNGDSGDMCGRMNRINSLELNNVYCESDITDDAFGVSREIEGLIRENEELVETKNALNVVKDDLIKRIDILASENDAFREDLSRHFNREADFKAKLSHLEQDLRSCREELATVRDSQTLKQKLEAQLSLEKTTFSRGEMAILLEEKNYYKEKLMELQDAVVYKEMCRVKKQFPEIKDSPKPTKSNNSSIWNLFSMFKKEEVTESVDEKLRNLISRFRYESDRSQLYSWSVPRSLIESAMPKRIPIPIKVQTVFEPKDVVICITTGYEESQTPNSAAYLWCLVQANLKNNKNYYLIQMCLTEKVPELVNKYSISLQFSNTPFTMCEVPGLAYTIKDFEALLKDQSEETFPVEPTEDSEQDSIPSENASRIYSTKVQIKNKTKHNIGSKTLWFGCDKNQIIVYILLDHNKVENRMAILNVESEIEYIRYDLGRVFVIQRTGSLCVFELNKENNQWELNQCLIINVSDGLPISDVCCDQNSQQLWLGSSTNCFILDLSILKVHRSLQICEDCHLTDVCTSIESMVIVDTYGLMLLSVSRIGLLLGYDLKTFTFKVSMDLKPSVYDLIEPVQGIAKSTLSLFHLAVDSDRIWMTTDCGMTLVVTLDTLNAHIETQAGRNDNSKCSLQTDRVYISSHAFAQSIKVLSLLSYSSAKFCLADPCRMNGEKEISKNNSVENLNKKNIPESNFQVKKYLFMTAVGSNYVNLNNSAPDLSNRCNHAIVWKI